MPGRDRQVGRLDVRPRGVREAALPDVRPGRAAVDGDVHFGGRVVRVKVVVVPPDRGRRQGREVDGRRDERRVVVVDLIAVAGAVDDGEGARSARPVSVELPAGVRARKNFPARAGRRLNRPARRQRARVEPFREHRREAGRLVARRLALRRVDPGLPVGRHRRRVDGHGPGRRDVTRRQRRDEERVRDAAGQIHGVRAGDGVAERDDGLRRCGGDVESGIERPSRAGSVGHGSADADRGASRALEMRGKGPRMSRAVPDGSADRRGGRSGRTPSSGGLLGSRSFRNGRFRGARRRGRLDGARGGPGHRFLRRVQGGASDQCQAGGERHDVRRQPLRRDPVHAFPFRYGRMSKHPPCRSGSPERVPEGLDEAEGAGNLSSRSGRLNWENY